MLGHRGVYKDGWKAVTHHEAGKPFDEDAGSSTTSPRTSRRRRPGRREPARLKELVDLWWAEAERHGVLPLDDRPAIALFARLPAAGPAVVEEPVHLLSAAVAHRRRRLSLGGEGLDHDRGTDHPAGGGDGALMARGSLNSGYVLMVKDGRLAFDYNDFHSHTRVAAPEPLSPGPHTVALKVERAADGGGDFELSIDGRTVASAHAPRLLFMISSTGMDLGRSLSPVTADYAAPFAYPGRIAKVVCETPRAQPMGEVKAQVRAEMTRQ